MNRSSTQPCVPAEPPENEKPSTMYVPVNASVNVAVPAAAGVTTASAPARPRASTPNCGPSSVIGLTIYFNRFNTVFRVDLTGSDAPYDSFGM